MRLLTLDLTDVSILHIGISAQVFNPPYVPTPDEEVERKGIAQAWAGGYKGRAVTDLVLPKVKCHEIPR